MSETEKLLIASRNGDTQSVQSLLAIKEIEINCKDISIQIYS